LFLFQPKKSIKSLFAPSVNPMPDFFRVWSEKVLTITGSHGLYRYFQVAKHDCLYQKFLQGGPGGAVFSKRGSATPTHSRSARWRSLGASSQKFAEKTRFHKVLVKRAPGRRRQKGALIIVPFNGIDVPAFFFHQIFNQLKPMIFMGH
jgi:hypothetical protein